MSTAKPDSTPKKPESTPKQDGDLESGTGDKPDAADKLKNHHAVDIDNALKHLYFPIYCLSITTFVAGAFMVFVPHEFDLFRLICGNLLFVNGCMLMTSNDLIVTTIRMRVQICIMARENARLSKSVNREAKEVAKLQKVSTGLEKLQNQFANNVKKALHEVDKYAATTMTTVRLTAAQLVKWYLDSNSDGVISRGPEQDRSEKLVSDFFRGAVSDFEGRHKAWTQALNNNSVYVALNGIPTEKFALLISAMLARDWEGGIMQTQVDRILNPQMDPTQLERYQKQKDLATKTTKASTGSESLSNSFSAIKNFGVYDDDSTKVDGFNMADYSKAAHLTIHGFVWFGMMVIASATAVVFGFVL